MQQACYSKDLCQEQQHADMQRLDHKQQLLLVLLLFINQKLHICMRTIHGMSNTNLSSNTCYSNTCYSNTCYSTNSCSSNSLSNNRSFSNNNSCSMSGCSKSNAGRSKNGLSWLSFSSSCCLRCSNTKAADQSSAAATKAAAEPITPTALAPNAEQHLGVTQV